VLKYKLLPVLQFI